MKKYIFIFIGLVMLVFINNTLAQTLYHSDTLFNDYRNQGVTNMIKNKNGYICVVNDVTTNNLNIIYTNDNLNQINRKEWNVFDSLYFHHYPRSITTLSSKNKLIIGTTWRNMEQYGALIEMDSMMQDTIRTKKISINYNGLNYITTFYDGISDINGNTWITGTIIPTDVSYSLGIVLKLDSDYNIITQHIFDFPNTVNKTIYKPMLTTDGGCIVRGTTRTTTGSCGTYQVFAAKVDSLCNRLWYREYGNPNMPDGNSTVELFKSTYPNKFWFVYGEGQRVKAWDPFCDEPYIRFKAILLDEQGNEYMTKYMTDTIRFAWSLSNIQLPDKSIVMGVFRTVQDDDDVNVMNFASLYKFSPNMDSVWRKLIVPPRHFPFSYERNLVTSILQDSNGDFVCGGVYEGFDPSYPEVYIPWVARIDSTGCGEQACAVVATENLQNPTKERFLRIFPNPATQYITLEYDDFQYKYATITDILGRVQKNIALQEKNTNIDISNLQNGIYYVSIYDENNLIGTTKFVVQHE